MNDGALIVNYTGHAGVTEWAHESLLDADGVARLRNRDRLPLVLSMTCYDGMFSAPGVSTVSEGLVRSAHGGAIASFAGSGLSVAKGHEVLSRGFFNAVYDRDVRAIGAAALLAKVDLYRLAPQYGDLVETFAILGDPGLVLKKG